MHKLNFGVPTIEELDGDGFLGQAYGIPQGLATTPEWITIEAGKVCQRKSCDFRNGCKGIEKDHNNEFCCHYGELIRSYKH